jgi:hypothetical protein
MSRWDWIGIVMAGIMLGGQACGRKAPPPGKPDSAPPEVRIVRPQPGQQVAPGDTVPLILEIHDQSPIVKGVLRLSQGDTLLQDTTPPLSFSLGVDTSWARSETLKILLDIWDKWENRRTDTLTLFCPECAPPDTPQPGETKDDGPSKNP